MYKLKFHISHNCFTDLNRYSASLNLPIQTIMRHIIFEQVLCYDKKPDEFKKYYVHAKALELVPNVKSDYENETKTPKIFLLKVNEYIYSNIKKIESEYNTTADTVVNKLLHIGIGKILDTYDRKYSTPHKYLAGNTKQYAIPLSNAFTERLQEIAKIKGIKINQLMSLIIGDFLINNYTNYNDDIYIDAETGECNHDVW